MSATENNAQAGVRRVRALLTTLALAILCASWGCVADRPSRNGVYNENQYLRKAFIIRPAAQGATDPGWMVKATIVSTSSPNPLGQLFLGVGIESQDSGPNPSGSYIRFNVTSDKLQMLDMRELDNSQDIQNQGTRTPTVVNAWPITNVDLKYRVNLDGEKTNYYEENQELDWQQRQWVKINLDKNDMSDLAPLGPNAMNILNNCTDVGNISSTLVPGSFIVDEANDYMQWTVQVTIPIKFDTDPNTGGPGPCTSAYGDTGVTFQKLGRQNVTLNLMYSLMRAKADSEITYKPLVIDEKDPVRRKYGIIDGVTGWVRDLNTGLLGATQYVERWDPQKPITYYLAPGFPSHYYYLFTCNAAPNAVTPITTPHNQPCDESHTIEGATNQLLQDAGVPARLTFLNYNDAKQFGDGAGPPRQMGDIRYSFIRWISDIGGTNDGETGNGWTGVTQFVSDPRTGETLSTSINIQGFPVMDWAVAHIDYYMQTIGAYPATNPDGSWMDGPAGCQDGDTMPLVPDTVANLHNGNSTVYAKMQQYLQRPVQDYGKLGPADFIVKQDQDFYNAFYALLPYEVFNDPAANQFVVPQGTGNTYGPQTQMAAMTKEAEFHDLMQKLDTGWAPYDVEAGGATGVNGALAFLDNLQDLTLGHRDYEYLRNFAKPSGFFDSPDLLTYFKVIQKDSRHCVDYGDGKGPHWETRDEYIQNLTDSFYALTIWHEFGHSMGMEHNFMGSVDRPNFPHYSDKAGRDHIGMYQSTVMEYNSTPDSIFWTTSNGGYGWGPYDQGAISFVYANTSPAGPLCTHGCSVSGLTSTDPAFVKPWNDPHGFNADGSEIQYLYCNNSHLKYTPFCRQFDYGSTPSEIVANDIDTYEWNYKWANFRLYRKFWDDQYYASRPARTFTELRRFMPVWYYDWSPGELSNNFRLLGINPPPNVPAEQYYSQLTNKFNADISMANQLVAAFHKAVIQQSSGERPFVTLYDPFFGDVTQQGIIDDKVMAMQSWTALWKTDNYDPTQAQGAYTTSYGSEFGDASFETVAENSVQSMIGGQYDIFPFGKPLAVLQFAKATHDTNFIAQAGRPELRDWVGGKIFWRERDFLDYVRAIAVAAHAFGCTSITDPNCTWDPRQHQAGTDDNSHSDYYNQFLGPDGRRYIWAYVPDRNAWVLADRDRNTATYTIMYNYTADIINAEDDGNIGPAYQAEYQMRYFIDYYTQFNDQTGQ